MARGGLDPFLEPPSIYLVTSEESDGFRNGGAWTYPGIDPDQLTLQDLRSRMSGDGTVDIATKALFILHPGVGDFEPVLTTLDTLGAEAILLPAGTHTGGRDGGDRQAAIRSVDARVMGPNASVQLSQVADGEREGETVAVVADDPDLATTVAERAEWDGSRVGPIVGVGAAVDVGLGEVAGALAERESIDLVMGHAGAVDSRFVSGTSRVGSDTPIAIHPAAGESLGFVDGTSIPGAVVSTQLLEQSGVVPVDSLEEMVEGAPALAGQPTPDPESVVVVSNAGGPGVMAIDAVGASGMAVARMEAATIDRLESVVPAHGSARNPLDLLADSDIEVFETVLATVLEDPNVGSAVVISAPSALFTFEDLAEIIAETTERHDAPVVTALMGGERTRGAADILREAGIPNYFDPYRAVGALDLLRRHGAVLEARGRTPDPPGFSESDLQEWFEKEGAQTLTGHSAESFVATLGQIEIDVSGEDGVGLRIEGHRVPGRGPLVVVGVESFAQAVGDVAIRAAPLGREDALEMLRDLRAAPLLTGARGREAVATDPVVDLIQGLSHLLAIRRDIRTIALPGARATSEGLEVRSVEIEPASKAPDPMPRG